MPKDKYKNAKMPSEHYEHDMKKCAVSGREYSGDFDAPEHYYKNSKALADYVRNNKAKH